MFNAYASLKGLGQAASNLSVSSSSANDPTTIHEAAAKGDLRNFKKLLKHLGTLDNVGRTPLHVACEEGQVLVVQFLLREKNIKGVDLTVRDKSSYTPLLCAANTDVNISNSADWATQHLQIIKLLLEKGADPSATGGGSNSTLLHRLAKFPHSKLWEEVVDLAIAKGAEINVVNKFLQTPLMMACSSTCESAPNVVKYFIDKHSADVNKIDQYGENCAHIACHCGNLAIFKILRQRCVDLNVEGKNGNVYQIASARGRQEFVSEVGKPIGFLTVTPEEYITHMNNQTKETELEKRELVILARLEAIAKEEQDLRMELKTIRKDRKVLQQKRAMEEAEEYKPPDVEKQGYLDRLTGTISRRRQWVVVNSESIIFYLAREDKQPVETVQLLLCSAKKKSRHQFEILTNTSKILLETRTEEETDAWIKIIENSRDTVMKEHLKDTSDPHRLRKVAGNQNCADCGSPDPAWASINLGVIICLDCAGAHRHLGTHISQVRSISFDRWSPQNLEYMKTTGNKLANSYWEFHVTPEIKPTKTSTADERAKFITNKYEKKAYIPQDADFAPTSDETHKQTLKDLRTYSKKLAEMERQQEEDGESNTFRRRALSADSNDPTTKLPNTDSVPENINDVSAVISPRSGKSNIHYRKTDYRPQRIGSSASNPTSGASSKEKLLAGIFANNTGYEMIVNDDIREITVDDKKYFRCWPKYFTAEFVGDKSRAVLHMKLLDPYAEIAGCINWTIRSTVKSAAGCYAMRNAKEEITLVQMSCIIDDAEVNEKSFWCWQYGIWVEEELKDPPAGSVVPISRASRLSPLKGKNLQSKEV